MTIIQKKLFELQDKEYAVFQAGLTPTLDPSLFIGVRVPACRSLAKDLYKNDKDEVKDFLSRHWRSSGTVQSDTLKITGFRNGFTTKQFRRPVKATGFPMNGSFI